MNNYDDALALIEIHLDSLNYEYQSHYNQIEIYSTEQNTIIIKIKNDELLIISDDRDHRFTEVNDCFFEKLDSLLTNF